MADPLDAVTAARATEVDLTYVSVIDAFTGHDVCADERWILGLFGASDRDACHPNTAGPPEGLHAGAGGVGEAAAQPSRMSETVVSVYPLERRVRRIWGRASRVR